MNNFAVDANYTFEFDNGAELLAGLSYQHATAYCQDYEPDPRGPLPVGTPITVPHGVRHFEACSDENPGVAAYLKYQGEKLTLLAEYAQTLDEWPGTHNPNIPQFEAQKNTTFTLGGSYDVDFGGTIQSRFPQSSAALLQVTMDPTGRSRISGSSRGVCPGPQRQALRRVHSCRRLGATELPHKATRGTIGESWSDQDSTTDAIVLGVTAAY